MEGKCSWESRGYKGELLGTELKDLDTLTHDAF